MMDGWLIWSPTSTVIHSAKQECLENKSYYCTRKDKDIIRREQSMPKTSFSLTSAWLPSVRNIILASNNTEKSNEMVMTDLSGEAVFMNEGISKQRFKHFYYIYLRVRAHACAAARVWRSEGNLPKSVLSYHVDWGLAIGLWGSKASGVHPLSRLVLNAVYLDSCQFLSMSSAGAF